MKSPNKKVDCGNFERKGKQSSVGQTQQPPRRAMTRTALCLADRFFSSMHQHIRLRQDSKAFSDDACITLKSACYPPPNDACPQKRDRRSAAAHGAELSELHRPQRSVCGTAPHRKGISSRRREDRLSDLGLLHLL